ncbi:MAG: amino acid ABC transporter ATP-binding protein [Microcystis wesenbergii TW10]|jgi:polar amino acid transport system ATP-binding protein|uniref:Glutamate transport ATP-binding protein n=4 Tax=Microcystis TaxID=1125 RepID=A0A0A1VQR1_MICAE|nr:MULTISPECIES: amino acid ABC transporter ATP-binding protein [Microcystis]MCZ8105454.1 amino acid ABC transporter ATP-binding protein [Burkholderiales bacterium]REJ52469.1 MAG: amino acid ABC transporter ATP-binding protein [Microcystis wesenbergii TW10]TRT83291.1 MAG: amino acid ABC transporter ATP-binding protein [Microcystis aeruginosa Ma_OC_H_19870700_S124]MCZ8039035.1 amino acid ABC transporter ATP-binding protein [Microcystis sp. LE17-20A]MCZ8211390.1 amino acid ABC transporter ATP-bi
MLYHDRSVIIKVENLCKSFQNLKVIKGISTEILSGEVVAIIGPSGSGKSTFLRCLNLLEMPSAGKIYFKGVEITDPKINIAKIRQNIGMVFQQFNLFPQMTALKNVMYALVKVKKLSPEVARQEAIHQLQKVGLADKIEVYPAQLSGGQKQRVAIARSLAMNPEIMLFDEPTSALDPEMIKEVLDVIKALTHTGMTMIIVTHEMGFAREVADRILFLDEGKVIEDSPPREFFIQPKQERARQFLEKIL